MAVKGILLSRAGDGITIHPEGIHWMKYCSLSLGDDEKSFSVDVSVISSEVNAV